MKNPQYQRAMKILNFPEDLRRFLSDPKYLRPFTVWSDSDSRPSSRKDQQSLETRLLLSILDKTKQRSASSKSDVRVAFIHIGSLHKIHKFPEFAERRTKAFHLQFYTYGTHYSSRQRCGESEKFIHAVRCTMFYIRVPPCPHGLFFLGGIITFTPNAMHKDPVRVCQLIMQIGRHPLWGCIYYPLRLVSSRRSSVVPTIPSSFVKSAYSLFLHSFSRLLTLHTGSN